MIGAIAGDIIGSVYEHAPLKSKDFPLFHRQARFTDDTVLTVAVANAILEGRSYQSSIREIGRRYPDAGYGGYFMREDAVRNAVSLGGDGDTLACITGGIAEAWYGSVPADIQQQVMQTLPADLAAIVERFQARLPSGTC
jgi:ADP-ribosylglycohydrolase